MNYFLLFITAMITTLLLVPPIKRLAHAAGVIDEPNERKVHRGIIPRMGGLAMFFGCMVTLLIYGSGFEGYRGVFLGMVVIVIVGIVDDTIGLEPRLKFAGQIVAALAAILLSDVQIDFLGGVVGSHYSLGFLSIPLTLMWIVGVTNAINLSDGLDGLAGGISLIAFTCFGILAYQRGEPQIFTLCLVLVGAIMGFLKYNTHPAEIFMGDTGSLFLGYCLAVFSIAGGFKSVTALTLITPVLVLLVPIADTLWAIIRRIREGRSPFSADKMHFHHKLLDSGMDHSQTVSVIYAICGALALSAVALANTSNFKFLLLPLMFVGVALFLFQVVGIIDLAPSTKRISNKIDRLFSHGVRRNLTTLSLRVIQAGAAIYVLTFLMSLPTAPVNLLIVATIVMALVLSLMISRGKSDDGYLIFSYFFLAAVMVMLIDARNTSFAVLNMLEPFGFGLMAMGVFGKIIFTRKVDLFLSTPLEFFIFLVLVSIAMIPPDLRTDFNVVHNTLRTFFLFLAFKALALSHSSRESTAAAAAA